MIHLTGESLTINEVADVAFRNAPLSPLSDAVRHMIAIEFLTAAQAIYLRPGGYEKLVQGTSAAYKMIR